MLYRGELQVSDWVGLTLIWDIPNLANLLSHICSAISHQSRQNGQN